MQWALPLVVPSASGCKCCRVTASHSLVNAKAIAGAGMPKSAWVLGICANDMALFTSQAIKIVFQSKDQHKHVCVQWNVPWVLLV